MLTALRLKNSCVLSESKCPLSFAEMRAASFIINSFVLRCQWAIIWLKRASGKAL